MPAPPQQRPPQQATQGPVHRVPCPWCGQPNDFRSLAGDDMGGSGWGSQGLERGATIVCDVVQNERQIGCGRKSKVLAIDTLTIIRLVRTRG